MNYHKPTGIRLIYAICLFASLSLKAQDSKTKAPLREPDYNKSKIFNSLPASIEVSDLDLQTLVAPGTRKSQEISLPLASGKLSPFTGKVAYAFSNERMRTVTVQSTSFNGAVLTLSSVPKSDGTVRYTGRIFSYQHGDAFELQQKGDHYYWIKKNLYEMMAE
ncbi:hypothetical protein LZZ85_19325 [Terrimonas sp. NA20]|uniref:Uncharacterized protein n=1 Tax=Terrimonas ginsenosidimutans TaxID=2908004 RepID=A0ABS9KVV8_9BACT|nr:hypothetical protein [Terrimonas ginsenosidimutans]MCG2616460.1 hypothetical protein [Terrimonas ginsenosidimutans]